MMPIVIFLFTQAFDIGGPQRFLLMLPLCLSIAVVYKALRLESMRDLPAAAFVLFITIVLGMAAVGIGLWLVFSLTL